MIEPVTSPYLLFLGDVADARMAKTANGIYFWAKERCLAQFRLAKCAADLGLPEMSPPEAASRGARTFVIGIAPIGGDVPDHWLPAIRSALEAGMDVASGMHVKLASLPGISALAKERNCRLIDVRRGDFNYPVGNGSKRSGKRLLTVGTDCGVGKMYAALAITSGLKSHGIAADFRATGQTGILIAGDGICIDAVVADFMAGAAEQLSPDNAPDHWDIVEGQGSLHHPSYAGVSLALLHGSQPDVLVVCHDAARKFMVGVKDYRVRSLEECMEINLAAARLVKANPRIGGVCVNTSAMSHADALEWMAKAESSLDVPVCDPVRTGVEKIVRELV